MDRPLSEQHDLDRFYSLTGTMAHALGVLACRRGSLTAAITIDSYLVISWDPPTLGVSVYSGSRMMEALESAKHCTVSILSSEQKGIAQWLGEPGQPLYGLLADVPTATTPGGHLVIDGALAWFTFGIERTVELATHTLVAGPVLEAEAGTAAPHAGPLLRFHREYRTLG